MIRRTVHEWKKIAYGSGEDEIPEWAADRIASVARASSLRGEGGNVVLTHGRKDLRAGQIVGVIAAEGCALEILPKIDGLGDADIRRRLINMLSIALDIDIDPGRLTDLHWQKENLLEILIRLFATSLNDAVRRGMPRRYVGLEDDLSALRGRLDAKRQFTTLAASPERLACRYDALSPDIALNQIMKATVHRLLSIVRTAENQRLLRELAFTYADIATVPIRALRWDDVVIDRTNARWRNLLELARMLLGGRFQTTSAGDGLGFSLLFPMNELFEEYVARVLSRALRRDDFVVTRQGGLRHCLTEVDGGKPRFQTRPDIIISRSGKTAVVIDTKWKRLASRVDDPKQGVSQGDVYQMISYSRVYECGRVALLYPHHGGLEGGEGIIGRYAMRATDGELATATIDLSRLSNMQARLRDTVLRL